MLIFKIPKFQNDRQTDSMNNKKGKNNIHQS